MTVTEKEAEGLSRTFQITIPRADLAARLDARIDEIKDQVRLKGFRPGKVPASHIRRMFGRSMMDEIVEAAVSEATQKTLDERELRAASTPEISVSSDSEAVSKGDEDLEYELRVEVMPTFSPADPRAITLERLTAKPAEADVDAALAELASNQKVFEDKGEAAAEDGDAVVVDFVGRVDGTEFDGGTADGAEIVIGAGRLIPGFEGQLIGVKAGDNVQVEVTFPEDYAREDLQGRPAVFDVSVKEVRGPRVLEVSEELATQVGFEDLAALTEAVRANLERDFAAQVRQRVKRRLLDALDDLHDFELPQRMVSTEFDQIWRHVKADLDAGRIEDADAEKTEDQLREEYQVIAARRVRLGLVLAEIGREAGVDVPEEELARAVNAEARRHPGREREVAEYFQSNAAARMQLRAPLFEEKVVDYILELAAVTDVETDRETLFADE